MKMNKQSIITNKDLVFIGLFTALTAVLSQVAIPLPTGVPITLQTFAVALAGYYLGWVKGAVSIVVYIMLGAVGAPVFSNWKGGYQVLVGPTGGFIFGFVIFALLCGVGSSKKLSQNKLLAKGIAVGLGLAGLFIDHVSGALWYAHTANIGIGKSFLVVSLPYLVKDIISVAAAYLVSEELIRRLRTAKIRVER